MMRPTGLLRLIRPVNLGITLVAVVLGGVLCAGWGVMPREVVAPLLLAAASAMLVAAGGNALNDVFDVDVDAVNRPDRPLPSGSVSVRAARLVWLLASGAGIAVATMISPVHFALAVAVVALLYAYSARLKRVPFVGNVTIAVVVALTVIYGGWAVGSPLPAIIASVFAFLTTLAREIVKDVEDVEGDRAAGVRTIPISYGIRQAQLTACVSLLLTVVLTPAPFLMMDYSPLFLLLVVVADLLLLRCIWLLPGDPEKAAAASAWLKGAMVAGIVALFAAGGGV